MLSIYNSLTNRKEEFVPIEKNRIRIYVCGMTVYDFCHLGHARVMVVFDTIIRYLRYRGFDVRMFGILQILMTRLFNGRTN